MKPSGGVTGYCDYLLPEIDPKDKLVTARGIIRFLWYDPGYRVAGEALLDAVEEAFRNAGATHIKAFGPGIMPFHKNLSDRLVHIRALFTIHGYQHVGGELYLGWSNFARDALERLRSDAQMPAGVTVTVEEYYDNRDGAGKETPRPSTRLYAIASSGEKLGICETISANEYDGSKELAETCFVSWLGVPPDRDNLQPSGYSDRSSPVQGQGLGVRSRLPFHCFTSPMPCRLISILVLLVETQSKFHLAHQSVQCVVCTAWVHAEESPSTLVAGDARTRLQARQYLY